VLVVDDDPSILDTVTAILTSEGYQVAAANGGEEALAMLRSCIRRSSYWTCACRSWTAGPLRARCVRVVRRCDRRHDRAENARRWADEIGAAGHLDKPFGLDQLLSCVEEHGSGRKPN